MAIRPKTKCSARKPTACPAVFKMKLTIVPMSPGNAAAPFLAKSRRNLPNFFKTSLILSGMLGFGGPGGVGPGVGVGITFFKAFAIPRAIAAIVIPTAVTKLAIVTPSFLNSSLILSPKERRLSYKMSLIRSVCVLSSR